MDIVMKETKMKTCSGCAREFDDNIPLYPRLILSKEAQVARKLAEKSGNDVLCLTCWMESIQSVDPKDLALLLLGMLDTVSKLREEIFRNKSDVIEKIRDGGYRPYTEAPWTSTPQKVYTGDSITVTPWIKHETTYSTGAVSKCSLGGGDVLYLSGIWSQTVSGRETA